MATGMPRYNSEQHEKLNSRIEVFNQILLSMAGVRDALGDEGRNYIRAFIESHTYTDEHDEDAIDVKPLAHLLYNAAREHAAACAVRTRDIFSYLENAMIAFPEMKWTKALNAESSLRQKDAMAMQRDLHTTKIIFNEATRLESSDFFHKQRGQELVDLQARFVEFLLYRAQGVVDDGSPHISPVFNFAGRQMRLACVTQDYVTAATNVVETTVQLLLAMSRRHQDYSSAAFSNLRDMARHLVISGNAALEDGMRLSCDSYIGVAMQCPMFRTELPSPPSRQSPGSRQM